MARPARASKSVALLILSMLALQTLGASVLAAGTTDSNPAPLDLTLPPAAFADQAPAAAEPAAVAPALNPDGEPLTARQAIARLVGSDTPAATPDGHPAPPDPSDFMDAGGRVPLADTDQNDPAKARWINRTDTQFTGENINGANDGNNRRTDIDWWVFHLNYTTSAADTVSFDITKDAWDHVVVIIWAWPDADPFDNSQIVRYEYMNRTQGLGAPSTFQLTAFENMDYLMLIQNLFVRNSGVSVVNYSITNIQFSTAAPEDDNNNLTSSEVLVPAALPTNREVDQAQDLYDVFELTSLLTIDKNRGDDAQVSFGVTVGSGRTGFTDVYNSSSGGADGDTVISVARVNILYRDAQNFWRTLQEVSITPGNSGTVSGLINGTPAYAVVYVEAFGQGSGVTSSVPGWVRYNVSTWSLQEDHAPVQTADVPTKTILEDTPSSGVNLVDLSLYFTDDLDAGALRFSVTYPPPSNPYITPTVSGNWLSVAPKLANWSGNVQVQVAAHDRGWDRIASTPDDHATRSTFFTVQVQAVNDPPTLQSFGGISVTGAPLSFTVAQDQTLVLSAVATDPEDASSLTWSLTPTPPNASFNTATGLLTLAPRNADIGDYTCVLSVRDPAMASYNLTVTIHYTNVNDPPRFVDVGGIGPGGPYDFVAVQGTPFTIDVTIDDPDYTIGVPQTFNFAVNRTFVTVAPDPTEPRRATVSFTPTNAQVGVVSIRLSVGDGPVGVFNDNVTLTVAVSNRNDGPQFTHVGTTFGTYPLTSKTYSFLGNDGAQQGTDFGFTVRASDPDVEAGLGDLLTFETDKPGKVFVTVNPAGLSADLHFVPSQQDAADGQVQIRVYVNDSGTPSLGDVLTIIIDVANVNDAPVLTQVLGLNLTEDEPFSFTFEAVDPDGDPVTFSSDSPLFPVDSTTGFIDFTPTNLDIGGADKIFEVVITARDTHGGVSSMRVTVVIRNVNDPPSNAEVRNPLAGQTFAPGETITFTGTAVDIDKDETATLTYEWFADGVSLGQGQTVTASLVNENEAPRTVEVRMQVTDAHGASVNQTVSVTVAGKPKPQPGFEGPAALLALAGIAAAAGLGARRRRRAE